MPPFRSDPDGHDHPRDALLEAVELAAHDAAIAALPAPRPTGRDDELLAAAMGRRPRGRATEPGPDERIDEVESFRRTVAEIDASLATLDSSGWLAPVPTYGRVRDLVAHLIGIEAYVGAQLGLGPAPTPAALAADLVGLTEALVAASRFISTDTLLHTWRARTTAVLAAVVAPTVDLDAPAQWHGQAVRVRDLLVIRTFELWTHTDDVRTAVGATLTTPDGGRLLLMTGLALHLLPTGIDRVGRAHPRRTARVVLTGAGGGAWTVPLGAVTAAPITTAPITTDEAAPDVLLVADATDFCRVAANRLRADDLVAHVEGDPALAEAVLTGSAAFALD